MNSPETSIIIRAFNEEKHLPGLLASIREQSYTNYEIVLVDSGSVDRTDAIALEQGARVIRIDSHNFTFGYSLNEGIRHSRGQFLVIVSAHTKPMHADWLRHLIEPLRSAEVAMVYGCQRGGQDSKYGELRDFYRQFGEERMRLSPPRFYANNANAAIRRDLWEKCPFNETLPGLEDAAWAKHWMEKGFQIIYEPKAGIFHFHEETWSQVWHRYYRESVAVKLLGLQGRKDILPLVVREARYLAQDLLHLIFHGPILKQFIPTVRFRSIKARATGRGLWEVTALTGDQEREDVFFDKTFKTVVIHGPGRASVEEELIPQVKPGEVLIRVAYEGVCHTDIEVFEGTLGYFKSGLASYPIVPGHEFSGRIVKVGPKVNGLQEGDPVVVECIQSCGRCASCKSGNPAKCAQRQEMGVMGRNGGYAEYVLTAGRFVHRIPDSMELKKAALCEPLAVVLKGIKRLERVSTAGVPQSCLVIGGGTIGHLAALILSSKGHAVSVFDQNPSRRASLAGTTVRPLSELGDLSAYDVFIEATGDPECLDQVLNTSPAGARHLLLGFPYGQREFNFETVVGYDKIVIGSIGSGSEEFREAIGLIPTLPLDKFLESIVPLADFQKAWQLLKEANHLKIMIEVNPSLNDYKRAELEQTQVAAASRKIKERVGGN